MLENDCNGNPNSSFPPCYAFQMILTALAPRLIQSIGRNVHNKNRALKRLWRHNLLSEGEFKKKQTQQDFVIILVNSTLEPKRTHVLLTLGQKS